ncbi:MAG: hypothetical protein LBL98_08465 [Ruminococcus sp.]|jgi:hypothetical protein|nr:hypothetical protein [Ruminococcus sp.]
MKLTGEILSAVKSAKTPEELITIADKMGVTVSESDAALYYNRLHTEPELTDDELEAIAVSGGLDLCDDGAECPRHGCGEAKYQGHRICRGCSYLKEKREPYRNTEYEQYFAFYWCDADPEKRESQGYY